MNHLKEENDRLYFELRHDYDERERNLQKQKEYLTQLQDFAQVISGIDDEKIGLNYNLMQ